MRMEKRQNFVKCAENEGRRGFSLRSQSHHSGIETKKGVAHKDER